MHEFGVSQEIAKVVLHHAEEQNAAKVLRVEIEIGELSFLNPEQIEFWVKISFEKTIADEAEINIEITKPQVSCADCGYLGELRIEEDPMYHVLSPSFSCPKCNSSKIEIEKGRECLIKRIEMVRRET